MSTATPTVLLLWPSLLSLGTAAPEPLEGPAKDRLIAQTPSQVPSPEKKGRLLVIY